MGKSSKSKNDPVLKEPTVLHSVQQTARSVQTRAEVHAGPIPSPDVFKRYGEVVPDAPERILKVFEQDSQHTRDMQKTALMGEISRDRRAQWMAFVVMLAALGVTAYAIVTEKNITAAIAGLGTLFLALGVLFGNKNKSKDSNAEALESDKE